MSPYTLIRRAPLLLITLLMALLIAPSPVLAFSLFDQHKKEEEPARTLSLGAFARTRFTTTLTEGAPPQPGADVVMARLSADARFKELGHALLIVENSPNPSLLDALIDLNFGAPAGLTLGLMRTPLSRELLINIPVIPSYDRAWLSSTLAPRRRVGALLHGSITAAGLTLRSQLGAFNPTSALRAGEDGVLLIGALDLTHTSHLSLHVAGMTHALKPLTLPNPDTVYLPGEQLDVALFYDGAHLRVLAEGLLARQEARGTPQPFGLHGFVAYRFTPSEHPFAYEPALSGDYVALPDGSDIQRVTANLHWLLSDRNLQASLGYGWEARTATTHRLLAELQILY